MKKNYTKKIIFIIFCIITVSLGYGQVITVKQVNTTTGWNKTLVNSETVSFPTAAAAPSSFSFQIKNDGASDLLLSGTPIVSVSGTDASLFTVTQPPVNSLTAGSSTSFIVTFNPTTSAIANAQIGIANNSAVNPFIVNLKGAAFDFYGPAYPPIGTISTDSNGTFGRPGGGNLLITNVSLATKTQTYWGPRISSTGDLMLKVSLDNGTYINTENLTFSPTESNLTNGQAVWRGNTFIQNAITFSTVPVFIRATLTTKRPDNSIVPLINPATLGLSEQVGGLVQFNSLSDYLVANYFIEASLNGTTWQPYLNFYDSYPTPPGPLPGQGIGNAYSTVGNGFYWVNLGPRLTQNAILNIYEGATSTIDTSLLNATDDEDMPANPQNLVFHFETTSPGDSPLAFEHGNLKLNGVVLTKTSTFTLADIQNNLLSYEHDGSESVYEEFQFSLRDSKQKVAADGPNTIFSFRINVIPVNDAPVALDQTISTSYTAPYSGALTSTDTDSSSFTYSIVSNPSLGTISSFNATTGDFTYSPTSGSPGIDTFTFTVSDGLATSNIATITINLVNLPPIGTNSNFDTLEDEILSAAVNATDPEGTSVTFQLMTQGSKGTTILNSNGSFTYTPTTSLFGNDAFTYRAQDSDGNQSEIYTANIKIVPRIDPGDVLVVDKTLIRLYDTLTNQDEIITQNQGMTDALNVCYKPTIGLFVYDIGNGLIRVDTYTGVQSLVAPSSSFSGAPPINGPSGMTFDSLGNIVMATSSGIVKVNPATGVVTSLFSGGMLSYPTGVGYLNNGDLIVSDAGLITGGSSKIIKITPAGVQSLVSSGGFITLPLDFAIIDQSTIVIADAGGFAGGTDRVYKVNIPDGNQSLLSTGGDIAIPSGIDYRQNKVYVVNKGGSNKILSIDSNTGTQSVVTGTSITNPWGLMVVPENIPPSPTAEPQTFCQGATVADLVAEGTALQWYTTETGGSALAANTVLSTTTYYVSQTLNGVESNRTAVEITITPQPIWYLDTDNDGYSSVEIQSCTSPGAEYVTTGILGTGDCDDTNPAIKPSATEICWNNIDDNCDGTKSEGCAAIPVYVNNPGTITNFATALSAVAYTYPGATTLEYRYEVTNMATSQVREFTQSGTFARYFTIPTDIRGYATQYQIRASAVINGEVVPYAVAPITVTSHGIPTITLSSTSCNTVLPGLNTTLSANPGLNANYYQFRLRLANDNGPTPTYYYVQSASRFVSANSFIGLNLQYNSIYFVSVQYSMQNNGGELLSGYGSECVIVTPSIPTIGLSSPICGSQVTSMGATISANPATYSLQYQFRARVTSDNGPSSTYYYTVPNASRFSTIASFQGLALAYDTQYSISVRYKMLVNGSEVWSSYGTECIVRTPFFPTTEVTPSFCGLETPTPLNQTLTIVPYPGFPMYRVLLEEVIGETLVTVGTIDTPYSNFRLNMFPGAQLGKTYGVSVSIKLNGEFGPYGKSCDVFTAAARVREIPFSATAYPNPFADGFKLDVKTSSSSMVNVTVYDMLGRQIETRSADVNELNTNSIGANYPSGVYNVIVTQDEEVSTIRMIKR